MNWLAYSAQSVAQAFYESGTTQVNFINLDDSSDLSHPVVYDVEQDKQGFIWIATQDGLNRFDGKNFVLFRHSASNPYSIGNDWIWDLHVDSQGRLWAASEAGFHLFLPKQNGFKNFLKSNEDSPIKGSKYRVIAEAPNGDLWFGSQDSGITVLNPKTNKIRSLSVISGALSSNKIRDIFFDKQANVWVATSGGGINKLAKDYISFEQFNSTSNIRLPSDDIRSIFQDKQGRIWVGTNDKGVILLNPERGVLENIFSSAHFSESCADKIRDIHQDSYGVIRLATDKGICQWDEKNNALVRYQHQQFNLSSLISNNVNSLFEDAGGVVWVSTYEGISRWNIQINAFKHISKVFKDFNQMTSDAISAFAMQQDGTLLVGTWGGGINSFDPESGEVSQIYNKQGPEGLKDNRIMSLYVDGDDTLWVGTFSGGLHRKPLNSDRFEVWSHENDNPQSLSSNSVSSILRISDGRLAIGTYGGGLNLLESSGKLHHIQERANSDKHLSHNRVTSLAEKNGELWIGTQGGGVSRYSLRDQTFKHFNKTNSSIGTDNVFSVLVTKNAIWLASQDVGVVKLTEPLTKGAAYNVSYYNRSNGLSSDFAYGLLADDLGNIWVSHSKGVSRIEPETGKILNFNPSHGLQGKDFNAGAYYKSASGQLLFGGARGFNIIQPDALPVNRAIPKLALVDVYFNNKKVYEHVQYQHNRYSLDLDYSDKYLELIFAVLDYTDPSKNQYQYRWGNDGAQWNTLTNNSSLVLAGLSDGSHRLFVRGSNNDGVWSEQPLILDINIASPWYKTSYAYLSYLIAIGLLILLQRFHHKRVLDNKQLRQEELEQLVDEKTAQIKSQLAHIESISQTDALTGAYNRRFLDGFIPTEIKRIKRFNANNSQPEYLAVISVDLDYFKGVNDTYGHEAGDKLLKLIVALLTAQCRKTDRVVRLGGEEFLIISSIKSRLELIQLVERIRSEIEHYDFAVSTGLTLSCTCSIGATFDDFKAHDEAYVKQLLKLADRLMYLAKQHGRNAWVIADNDVNSNENEPDTERVFRELVSINSNKKLRLHSSVQLDDTALLLS